MTSASTRSPSLETRLVVAAAVVLDDGASAAERALRSGRPLTDLAVDHYRWMLDGGYTPAPIETAAVDAVETGEPGAPFLLVDAGPQHSATDWTAPGHRGASLADVWTGGATITETRVGLGTPWEFDLVVGAHALERVEHAGYAAASLLRLREALHDRHRRLRRHDHRPAAERERAHPRRAARRRPRRPRRRAAARRDAGDHPSVRRRRPGTMARPEPARA